MEKILGRGDDSIDELRVVGLREGAPPGHPVDGALGDAIRVRGYDLASDRVAVGAEAVFAEWQAKPDKVRY